MHDRILPTLLLLALPLVAQDPVPPPSDPAEAFDRLRKEYGEAQREHVQAWREANRKAREAGAEQFPAFSYAPLAAKWVPRFEAEAKRFAGTDGALPFLAWVLGNGSGESVESAMTTVLNDHVESPELGNVVGLIGRLGRQLGQDRLLEVLTAIIEKNGHDTVRAAALLARGEANPDAEAGLADLRKAVELGSKRAEGILFEKENLQVGLKAPDIVGEDLDGVEFKLSDYRGKVVMLDFWGDW